MSVRIFVGKNLSSVVGKKIVGKKIRHWQKKSSFFADFFSDKVDDDIDFATRNRYAPLENIDESFNSSSRYNYYYQK